jgi:HK97 family phage major capsid protein
MRAQIRQLREQQMRIATNAQAKLDEIKVGETPAERAAEIEREFDAMMAEHDQLGARADRYEKLERAQRAANDVDPSRRPIDEQRAAGGSDEGEQITYRSAFHAWLQAEGNIGMLSGEQRAVLRAGEVKPKELQTRAQTTSNTAGGYTVPTELANILIRSMKAWGPMYDEDVGTVIDTPSGNQIPLPTTNDTGNSAAANGGQGVTLTDDGGSDVVFGQKTLDAYAFDTEWIRVSKELADDSIFAMETLLGSLLGERLGRTANSQLTTGTGSSAPNGIVTASTLGKTAASATAITADELIDLLHSVDPAYRSSPKAGWQFNDATLAVIRKLKDSDGRYIWQMGDIVNGIPGTLLGYRFRVNQAMDSIAAAKKVAIFGDFGKYYVRKVGGPLIGALQDKDFWPGFGVAGWIRFDGELGDTAAVKHLITAAS